MSKIRVYELAKQIEKDSAEIVSKLKELGIDVKNHMSSISDEDANKVKNVFSRATKKTGSTKEVSSQKAASPKKVVAKQRVKSESKIDDKKNVDTKKVDAPNNQPIKTEASNTTTGEKKKKHNISKVYNPQNSNQGGRGNYKNRNNNNRNTNGSAGNNNNNRSTNNTNANSNTNINTNASANANRSNSGTNTSRVNNTNGNSNGGNNGNTNGNNKRNGNNNNRNGYNNYNNRNNKNRNFGGRNNNQQKPVQKPEPKEEVIKSIVIPDSLTIKELADKMKVQPSALVKKLFLQGKMYTINQEVEFAEAEEIALEFEIIAELEEKVDVIEELLREEEEDETKMIKRPPVVCVMGHVDHGKTSLLDAIREAHVISHEAGGITQHIGAYTVNCRGEQITFLDTPGHEAFTAMRMRGAQSTDIAILVVAADDGVMPQTVEAINHAKAAGISIIVAVNKIDKPSANIEKVKQELAEYELIAEDWGGETVFVPVSAHTREGIDQLLEMIILTADICELKANPDRKARGLVLEAKLDKGRGTVATVLVQKGTLKVGDTIAAGSCYGKVRAMISDKGEKLKEAGPSTPIEILGLNSVPNAGEIFVATDNEKEARSFADTFISEGREKLLEVSKAKGKMSLDDLFSQIQAGDVKELNIIVKADVQGSVEAVKQSLVKLSNEEVVVKVIHGCVGAINESDVILASASNAIIIGFNVRPDNQAKEIADREKVDLRLYRVIYQAIEDVEAAMKGMLDPIYEEKVIGHAEIRQIFKSSGVGTIAGSFILDGMFQRGCSVRISREGNQIFEGPLSSLKRFKDDVKEVKAGYECGLVFEGFTAIQELDIVEAYIMVEVPR